MNNITDLIIRIVLGSILALFAIALGFITILIIIEIVTNSRVSPPRAYIMLAVFLMIFYFLCLLSYRVISGRGRIEDGGLLPPWGIMYFSNAFGIFATYMICFGVLTLRILPILIGCGILFISLKAYEVAVSRRTNEQFIA